MPKKGGFRKISSRALFRRIGRCSHPRGCGAIEPGKSVIYVCWMCVWVFFFLGREGKRGGGGCGKCLPLVIVLLKQ